MTIDIDALWKAAETALLEESGGYAGCIYDTPFMELFKTCCSPRQVLALLDEREKLLKVVEAAGKAWYDAENIKDNLYDALKELEST